MFSKKTLLILLYLVLINFISSCLTLKIADGHEHEYAEPLGLTYEVQKGDTLEKISKKFKIHKDAILDYNNIPDPSYISPGLRLYIASKKDFKGFSGIISPEKTRTTSKKKTRRAKKKKLKKMGKSDFVWPSSGILTSKFGIRWGRRHDGIDIGGPVGQEIRSTASGKVLHVEYGHRGYGNLVIIKHAQNFVSIYAHCNKIFVKKGVIVKQGQRIAQVGKTGRVTGPHLHFELRIKNRPVNPLRFLPRR